MLRQGLALVLLSLGLGAAAGALPDSREALFSADGYRIDRYRSPTPARAEGAETVSTEGVQALLLQTPAPLLIDVINLEYRAGHFLQSTAHDSLPSAVWLPNTGRGVLEEHWYNYLLDNTLALTGHNREHPVVVLCKSDCWLSWNAVKRLAQAGFRKLYWYREGVDGWANAGLPMHPALPVPPRFPSAAPGDS